jgi:hypothetical protein
MAEETRNRILKLQDDTGARSMAEVIRRALATYEYFWVQTQARKEVIVRDEEGEKKVEFIWS